MKATRLRKLLGEERLEQPKRLLCVSSLGQTFTRALGGPSPKVAERGVPTGKLIGGHAEQELSRSGV